MADLDAAFLANEQDERSFKQKRLWREALKLKDEDTVNEDNYETGEVPPCLLQLALIHVFFPFELVSR